MALHGCTMSPCPICTKAQTPTSYYDFGRVQSSPWAGGAISTWNGPICHVCGQGYLGICQRDHRPYVDTGYAGRHRNNSGRSDFVRALAEP